MNPSLYNFFLFLIWVAVGLTILVFGPVFAPNSFKGKQHEVFMGLVAFLLASWNLMRWWSGRSIAKARAAFNNDVRNRNRQSTSDDPPEVLPEFRFEDPPANPADPKENPPKEK